MDPVPDDQTQKRASLRDKCNRAVSELIQALDSQAQDAYRSDELTVLGVSLGMFDPNGQDFLNSKACLFEPLSSGALEEYSLLESELNGGALEYYFKFDEIYDHPTNVKNPPSSYIMAERAYQIFSHLDILYCHYEKKMGSDLVFLGEVSGWDQMKYVGNGWFVELLC